MSIAVRIVACVSLLSIACGDSAHHAPLTGVNATATPNPSTWIAPVDVSFNCDPVGGTAPYTYVWDFGDGTQAPLDAPGHTYTIPATYTATCQVTDADGQVASISVDLGVLPAMHGPHAQIDVLETQHPTCAVTGQTLVQLSSAGSTDPDGDTLWSEWALVSQPAGSTATLSSTFGTYPRLSPDVDGDYVVRLHVEDTTGLSDNVDLTITSESASQIVGISGDNQVAQDRESLSLPLVVAAETACGLGVAGQTVHFTAAPDVVLSSPTGITDANGQVATTVTAGCIIGTNYIQAAVPSTSIAHAFTFENHQGPPNDVHLEEPFDTDVSLPMILRVDVVDRCGYVESGDNTTAFTLALHETTDDGSAYFDTLIEGTPLGTSDPHAWVVQAAGGHVVAWVRDTAAERLSFTLADSQNTGLVFTSAGSTYDQSVTVPVSCNGGTTDVTFPEGPPPRGLGSVNVSGTIDANEADEAMTVYGEAAEVIALIFGYGAECTPRSTLFFLSIPQLQAYTADGTVTLRLKTGSGTDCICTPDQLRVELSYEALTSAKFTP